MVVEHEPKAICSVDTKVFPSGTLAIAKHLLADGVELRLGKWLQVRCRAVHKTGDRGGSNTYKAQQRVAFASVH